jgi:DNA-binding transcriptional ArsR family regulator
MAVRWTFQCEAAPVETIFRLATAFTHPRRIELFRAVKEQARTPEELRVATGMSARALERHRHKLEARGFLTARHGRSVAVDRDDRLGRELARLAAD